MMCHIIAFLLCLFANVAIAQTQQTFREQIESTIAEELSVKDIYVIFDGGQKIGEESAKDIQDLYVNYDDRKFMLVVLDKDKNQQITGKFDDAVYVAVLSDTFHKDHEITKEDVMLKKAPKSILKANMIINEDDLIGKVLTKKVSKGAAVFKHDLALSSAKPK